VINEICFPENPVKAIEQGFAKAEEAFIKKIYNPETKVLKDKSGSCAIVILII
jgi:protein phosphatase 2C family protein 2/3